MSQTIQDKLSNFSDVLKEAKAYLENLSAQIIEREKQLQDVNLLYEKKLTMIQTIKSIPIVDAKLELERLNSDIFKKQQCLLGLEKDPKDPKDLGNKFALRLSTIEEIGGMIANIRQDANDFVGSGTDAYYSEKITNGLDKLEKELCCKTRCCKCVFKQYITN